MTPEFVAPLIREALPTGSLEHITNQVTGVSFLTCSFLRERITVSGGPSVVVCKWTGEDGNPIIRGGLHEVHRSEMECYCIEDFVGWISTAMAKQEQELIQLVSLYLRGQRSIRETLYAVALLKVLDAGDIVPRLKSPTLWLHQTSREGKIYAELGDLGKIAARLNHTKYLWRIKINVPAPLRRGVSPGVYDIRGEDPPGLAWDVMWAKLSEQAVCLILKVLQGWAKVGGPINF